MIRLKLALLVLIASLSAGCQAEDSAAGGDQMMDQYRKQQAQYEAMQGSKVHASQQPLTVYRDKVNGVTCWSRYDAGSTLSCLPDWMLSKEAMTP